jgi:hypothetical protein
VEFNGVISAAGEIALPPEVISEVPAGEHLKVVIMREDLPESDLDAACRAAGRRRFEAVYAPEDSIYEQLLEDIPNR